MADVVWIEDHLDEWRFSLDGVEYSMFVHYDNEDRALVSKPIMDALLKEAGMYKYEKELNKNE